jgi:hypothetical protein
MRSPPRADPSALTRGRTGDGASFPQFEVAFRVDHVFKPHDHITSKDPTQPGYIDSVLLGIGRDGRTIHCECGTDLLRMRVLEFGRAQLIKRALCHPVGALPLHDGSQEARGRKRGLVTGAHTTGWGALIGHASAIWSGSSACPTYMSIPQSTFPVTRPFRGFPPLTPSCGGQA